MTNQESNKIVRKLINKEIELGFLHIQSNFKSQMPTKKSQVLVYLGKTKEPLSLSYNPRHRRVYGLTNWLRKNKANAKDKVIVEKLGKNQYRFIFKRADEAEKDAEITPEEAKEILDLSELSSTAKGDIVEDRIKELILLYGQGLLSVYKPVSDTEGIDLIVVKNGVFQPIFIQVKSRYTLNRGVLINDIRLKTFNPHHTYFVVSAYFDSLEVEIFDNLLLVPTEKIQELGIRVNAKNDERYRIVTSLKTTSKSKWAPYFVKKNQLAEKLLEKFKEIERYYK